LEVPKARPAADVRTESFGLHPSGAARPSFRAAPRGEPHHEEAAVVLARSSQEAIVVNLCSPLTGDKSDRHT
jgi:hypothetical protein